MLLPNQRIGSDGVQVVVVVAAKGPECNEVPLQDRLIIKGHAGLPLRTRMMAPPAALPP
jgi:hypothetical protein